MTYSTLWLPKLSTWQFSVPVGVNMYPARLKALAAILHLQQTLLQHKGLGRPLKTSFQNVNLALDGGFSSTPHSTRATSG